MNVVKGICKYIFDSVDEDADHWYEEWQDERYRDYTSFQHECSGWVDGVHFWCGGFAGGSAPYPDVHTIEWMDLDILEILEVKEGTLTPEEVEELTRFFNPERKAFNLEKVIPECFESAQNSEVVPERCQ